MSSSVRDANPIPKVGLASEGAIFPRWIRLTVHLTPDGSAEHSAWYSVFPHVAGAAECVIQTYFPEARIVRKEMIPPRGSGGKGLSFAQIMSFDSLEVEIRTLSRIKCRTIDEDVQ